MNEKNISYVGYCRFRCEYCSSQVELPVLDHGILLASICRA